MVSAVLDTKTQKLRYPSLMTFLDLVLREGVDSLVTAVSRLAVINVKQNATPTLCILHLYVSSLAGFCTADVATLVKRRYVARAVDAAWLDLMVLSSHAVIPRTKSRATKPRILPR